MENRICPLSLEHKILSPYLRKVIWGFPYEMEVRFNSEEAEDDERDDDPLRTCGGADDWD
jgi:hypothetical protein